MRLAILIPCHNRVAITLRCLEQIHTFLQIPVAAFDVIVVDDGSPDMTGKIVKERYPDTIILHGDGNLWWGGAVNMGFEYILRNGYDAVYLINDDIDFAPDTLSVLIQHCDNNPEMDYMLGSAIADKSTGKLIRAGKALQGKLKRPIDLNKGLPLDDIGETPIASVMLSGMSLFIPTPVLQAVGLIDTNRFQHNYGDSELTYRAGTFHYKRLVLPKSVVYSSPNPNYIEYFYEKSNKWQFIRSFFHVRYAHNFKNIYYSSLVARSFILGHYCFLRTFIRLNILVFKKLINPKKFL